MFVNSNPQLVYMTWFFNINWPHYKAIFGRRDLSRIINWNFPGFNLFAFKLNYQGLFYHALDFSKFLRGCLHKRTMLSSAKLHISSFLINKKISMIKVLKRRGRRIFQVTSVQSLNEDLIGVLWFRKLK